MKRKQKTQHLVQYLGDQIRFLQSSSAAYDSGFTGESVRLAASLRVLLHDTRRCDSLLGLLGFKRKLRYRSTAEPFSDNHVGDYHPLVLQHFYVGPPESRVDYVPAFVAPPPRVERPRLLGFREWWEEVIVMPNSTMGTKAEGHRFSRRDLILHMCDKQGGAHVDPALDEDYARLVCEPSESFYWRQTKPVVSKLQPMPRQQVAPASIRQITYELLLTLEKECPQYFDVNPTS